jgi:hypothetical protein
LVDFSGKRINNMGVNTQANYDILLKPQFDGQGGGGFLVEKPGTIVITTPDGQTETVRAGGQKGHQGWKASSRLVQSGLPQGSTIKYTADDGSVNESFNITEGGGKRHEFSFGNPSPISVSDKGALGSSGGFSGGSFPGGFSPVSTGANTVAAAYLGGLFPKANLTNFDAITAADYKKIDPFNLGKKAFNFNVNLNRKNLAEAKSTALQNIQTELQGLQSFVPAASLLKREQVGLDNIFNQAQRTAQVEQALPGVTNELNAQRDRAATYASGRLLDDTSNTGLEIGIRSEAADTAAAGGFGASSSVSRKASDLLSAKERFAISQFGETLTAQNIQQREGLLLAPTSYSDAGQQIRVLPEIGAGQQTINFLNNLNQATMMSPETFLNTNLSQEQFVTNLSQSTNQFNAQANFQESQLNANILNQFAMDRFQYDVGYAGMLAGSMQNQANVNLQLEQQAMATGVYQEQFKEAQKAGDKKALASLAGSIVAALGGGSDLINSITGLFSGDKKAKQPSSGTTTTSTEDSIYTSEEDFMYTPPPTNADPITVPSGQPAPDGYTPVATDSSGGTVYMPDNAFVRNYASFERDIYGR